MEIKPTLKKVRDLSDAQWGKRFFTANTWQTRRGLEIIKMGAAMLGAAKSGVEALPNERETFARSMERQGLSEKDLPVIEKGVRNYARVYGVLMVIFLVWALLMAKTLLGGVISLCGGTIAMLMWITWSLRLWQVRNQTLCTLSQFIAQPGWWKEWIAPNRYDRSSQ